MYEHLVDIEKNYHKETGILVVSLVFRKNDSVSQDMIDAYYEFYKKLLDENNNFIILYDLTQIGYNTSMVKLLDNRQKFRVLDDTVKKKVICAVIVIANVLVRNIIDLIPSVIPTGKVPNKKEALKYIKNKIKNYSEK